MKKFDYKKYIDNNRFTLGDIPIVESLSKKSLEGIDSETINDIHKGYYELADSINDNLRYSYLKASQDNPDWKSEYEIIKQIKKLFDKLQTGKIL